MKRTVSLLKSLTKFRTPMGGTKRPKFLVIFASLALAWLVVGSSSAFAHTADGTTTVTFSSNPAPLGAGTDVTITTTTTSTGHPEKVDDGKVQIQMANGVACPDAPALPTNPVPSATLPIFWCSLNSPGVSPVAGVTSLAVDLDARGFACGTVGGFRAHYVTGGSAHKVEQHMSAGVDLTASCEAQMPINKLIDGQSATCTAITDGTTDPNGNPDFTRPCNYPGGVQFTSLDPEFEVNVYETDSEGFPNPTPDSNVFDGGFYFPFPSPGAKVPPQFDPPVPVLPFPFTGCEAPASPYSLVGVEINVTPDPDNNNPLRPTVYYHADPNNPANMYACINTNVPLGTTEFAVNLDNSTVCTYTQGGWGSTPHGSNPGQILADNFFSATGGSVAIGDPVNGESLTFTSAAAVKEFLPAGGPASALLSSATDPTDGSNGGGVFAGQVLALSLNVALGEAGAIGSSYTGGIGNFLVNYPACYADPNDLPTVEEVLADANYILGGGAFPAPNGANCSYSDLNDLVTLLNESFDNCTAGPGSEILTPRRQD